MERCRIFEVKLERGMGYTYVKHLVFEELDGSFWHFIEPLNLYSEVKIKNKDDNFFENLLPLTGYMTIGYIAERGKYAWKHICDVSRKEYEEFVPDLRDTRGDIEDMPRNNDGEWHIIRNFDICTMQFLPYDMIKHLSWSYRISQKGTITRLTMVWMVRLGLDISKYYTQAELDKDFWLKYFKVEAEHMVFYDQIDMKLWNRLDVYPDYGKVSDMIFP